MPPGPSHIGLVQAAAACSRRPDGTAHPWPQLAGPSRPQLGRCRRPGHLHGPRAAGCSTSGGGSARAAFRMQRSHGTSQRQVPRTKGGPQSPMPLQELAAQFTTACALRTQAVVMRVKRQLHLFVPQLLRRLPPWKELAYGCFLFLVSTRHMPSSSPRSLGAASPASNAQGALSRGAALAATGAAQRQPPDAHGGKHCQIAKCCTSLVGLGE